MIKIEEERLCNRRILTFELLDAEICTSDGAYSSAWATGAYEQYSFSYNISGTSIIAVLILAYISLEINDDFLVISFPLDIADDFVPK
jgi:hypothetical protein